MCTSFTLNGAESTQVVGQQTAVGVSVITLFFASLKAIFNVPLQVLGIVVTFLALGAVGWVRIGAVEAGEFARE